MYVTVATWGIPHLMTVRSTAWKNIHSEMVQVHPLVVDRKTSCNEVLKWLLNENHMEHRLLSLS